MKNKIFVLSLFTALITAMSLLAKSNKADPTNYWPGKPWMCPDCHEITDPLIHNCDKNEESKTDNDNDDDDDNIVQNENEDE